MEKVFVLSTKNREEGISKLLGKFDLMDFKGRKIALKANYNSADPFPASSHLDTLIGIVKELRNAGAVDITLAERSGMGVTREVLTKMGVFKLSEQYNFKVSVLDELDQNGWVRINPETGLRSGLHWKRGFLVAKLLKEADKIVQTCCLKTHRFGGHFTLSLKNSVGLIAKHEPGEGYDYMKELHSSPHQRLMIAEINLAYKPDIILIDGIEAFVTKGPENGNKISSGVMFAGQDRVAVDAVGVATLRHYGTTREVNQGKIFAQEQIARAVELGIGVRSAKDIKLEPIDAETEKFTEQISRILAKG